MRPIRIRLEGFSAYRKPTEVDFGEGDFFSLSGPTGSGKSSLVDAMIFALFGRVPRLGGNAVAPVITAGADRARVSFEFEVGGETYTAVRMAQRTSSGGATVKEARLESGDRAIAVGADEVTREVEDLLRLRFDDFIRTVVLPQGEFSRFLTATKAERQGLLRNLLGLDVYTTVRELAKQRSAVAADRLENDRRSLDALELADEETLLETRRRRDVVAALADQVARREKELSALDRLAEEAAQDESAVQGAIERLRAIEAPSHLDELDALIATARSGLVDAEEANQRHLDEVAMLESTLADLPSHDQIKTWERLGAQLAETESRLSSVDEAAALDRVASTGALVEAASETLREVRSRLAAGRLEHSAHTLVATLEVGEPCPVCSAVVGEMPDQTAVPALDELESDEVTAVQRLDEARVQADRAKTELAGVQATLSGLNERKEELIADLAEAPTGEERSSVQAEIGRLGRDLDTARTGLASSKADLEKARSVLESLSDDSRQAARKLTAAQLTVADLDPPVPESDDVIVQWKDLIEWRRITIELMEERARSAAETTAAALKSAAQARESLVADLEKSGLPAIEPYSVQVAAGVHAAQTAVDQMERAIEQAAELRQRIEAAESDLAVADALASHLRANGFEQWLMAGALVELVEGANQLIAQLSAGGYSLRSDDSGSFTIVDHRNADETRDVKTLSGGETFLVSLALALSLAETLAAKGGSGLDAIILDEGFGTLDDESLDTVATVLEELTGRGLMVGVITHVKELAARAAVRFEVTREPDGARVKVAS